MKPCPHPTTVGRRAIDQQRGQPPLFCIGYFELELDANDRGCSGSELDPGVEAQLDLRAELLSGPAVFAQLVGGLRVADRR